MAQVRRQAGQTFSLQFFTRAVFTLAAGATPTARRHSVESLLPHETKSEVQTRLRVFSSVTDPFPACAADLIFSRRYRYTRIGVLHSGIAQHVTLISDTPHHTV